MEKGDPILSTDQLLWTACKEMPIQIFETEWCGAIVWQDWVKNNVWPDKWGINAIGCNYAQNRFLQKIINLMPITWKYWAEEMSRFEIQQHYSIWKRNTVKPVVMNSLLHSCWLHQMNNSKSWACAGTSIIQKGWILSARKQVTYDGGIAWTWTRWKVCFWESCIKEYSWETDISILKQFKREQMHLSHVHPLHLAFTNNLPDEELNKWIGRFTKEGWKGKDVDEKRYLVWFNCKLILCEECYKAPADHFIVKAEKKIHKHPLHLYALHTNDAWFCNLELDKCINKIKDKKGLENNKIMYRCDCWNFDVCTNCLIELYQN